MKIAPLHKVFQEKENVDSIIIHTGQHFDERMSDVFFKELNLPKPQYFLGIKEGSNLQRLANVMVKLEPILEKEKPDLMIVSGDVTSTLGGALTASKMKIPLAHIEAGLRSFDSTMPEETNRIITDRLSDFLFVTEKSGIENLKNEGIEATKIHFVGNLMIDTLVENKEKANAINLQKDIGIDFKKYALLTMHRPANVDNEENLKKIIEIIKVITNHIPVVFPLHPRTQSNFKKFKFEKELGEIQDLKLIKPQGYLSFIKLMEKSVAVITDSGGIQEETTFLKIPCITLRNSTERPCTIEIGTNNLVPNLDEKAIEITLLSILNKDNKAGKIPELWDGESAERVANILLN
jgi:UDP-N-acetylglucosamine 2-epimerase (non-hydrolysing)